MARVTKEMTMGELLQTYYEQCPEIVDVLTGLGNALHRMPKLYRRITCRCCICSRN